MRSCWLGATTPSSLNTEKSNFIIDARASNRHFLRLPSGPWLTGEGLCHVQFQGAPEDTRNWFVGSADIKNAFHQMRIPGWLQAFFPLPAVLASEVGYSGKTISQKRLAPDFLMFLGFFSWAMFFCQDVTDFRTLAGSADSLYLFCRPPQLHSNISKDHSVLLKNFLFCSSFLP